MTKNLVERKKQKMHFFRCVQETSFFCVKETIKIEGRGGTLLHLGYTYGNQIHHNFHLNSRKIEFLNFLGTSGGKGSLSCSEDEPSGNIVDQVDTVFNYVVRTKNENFLIYLLPPAKLVPFGLKIHSVNSF